MANNFSSIDEKLMFTNYQQKVAGGIREERQQEKRAREEDIAFNRKRDAEVFKQTSKRVFKVAKKKSIIMTIVQAMLVVKELRAEMDGYYMPEGVFYSLILLATIKDTIGVFTGGFFAFFVSCVVGFIMFLVLFGKRSLLSKIFKKKFLQIAVTFLAESIPVIAMAPLTVIGVIWLKFDFDKKYKEYKTEVEARESQILTLQKNAV